MVGSLSKALYLSLNVGKLPHKLALTPDFRLLIFAVIYKTLKAFSFCMFPH